MMPSPPAFETAAAISAKPTIVHAALDDRVLDAEEFGDSGLHRSITSSMQAYVCKAALSPKYFSGSSGDATNERLRSSAFLVVRRLSL